MSIKIPHHALIAMRDSANVLMEAIEADDNPNPERQIAYRKMAAVGTYDSTEGGSFQIIVEVCVDERFFLKDGDVVIITDPQYMPEPYRTMPPKNTKI